MLYDALRAGDAVTYPPADDDGEPDDEEGNGETGNEGDANGSSDENAELPEDLLLFTPRLLTPERTARRAEIKWIHT